MQELIEKTKGQGYIPYYFKGVGCEGFLSKRQFKIGECIHLFPVWDFPFEYNGKYVVALPDEREDFLVEMAKQIKRSRERGENLSFIETLEGWPVEIASYESGDVQIRQRLKCELEAQRKAVYKT